ncbi:MAG: HAD hydrolase-like protein [Deltaproteobacteria bacterium]
MYHLFFDLDGTLTDPAPGITACIAHAVRALGHTPPPAVEMRRFIGPSLREVFAEVLATEDVARIEDAVRLYRERFSTLGLYENSVYPALTGVLAQLRQDGFELRVVTSKAHVYADRIIDHFELREFFPRVYGAELSGARSSKAELIAHVLSSEAIEPPNACMIGDRRHDIDGAKAHTMAAIGVTWGYGTREELEAAGADRVIDALEELPEAVRSSSSAPRGLRE